MTFLRRHRFRLGIVTLTATTALALAGCSGGGDESGTDNAPATHDPALAELIAAAEEEGQVTWYSGGAPAQLEATVQRFEETFDIKVELVRSSTGPLITRYAGEAEAGTTFADVLMHSDPGFGQSAADEGWTLPLDQELLPALADWPADYVVGNEARLLTLPWTIDYAGLQVSEDDAPESFEDLTDSQWSGKLLLNDPRSGPAQAGLYNFLYETYGDSFLSDLADQNPKVSPSLVPGLQSLAAGEGSVFLGSTPQSNGDLNSAGAELKTVVPQETAGFSHYLSVSANAPHPNAARLFANWLLTPEGQAPLTEDNSISPLGTELVPDSIELPEGLELVDPEQTEQNLPEILRLLGL